jgi:hypothetical protein
MQYKWIKKAFKIHFKRQSVFQFQNVLSTSAKYHFNFLSVLFYWPYAMFAEMPKYYKIIL